MYQTAIRFIDFSLIELLHIDFFFVLEYLSNNKFEILNLSSKLFDFSIYSKTLYNKILLYHVQHICMEKRNPFYKINDKN